MATPAFNQQRETRGRDPPHGVAPPAPAPPERRAWRECEGGEWAPALKRPPGQRQAGRWRPRACRRGSVPPRCPRWPRGRSREARGEAPSAAARACSGPRSGPPPAVPPTTGRGEYRVDPSLVRLALHAQHPAHHVDPLRLPAGVDAETGRSADGGRLPRRRRLGDAPLGVGAGAELRRLVQGFARPKPEGTGRDRRGQGVGVAEFAPRLAREPSAAYWSPLPDPEPR